MSHSLPRTLLKLLAFLIFSLLLSTIVFSSLLASSTHGQVGYAADFSNASGLRSGNTVRIAGVQVGKVTSVKLRGDHARVSFKLDDNQYPTTTTKAAINYANLLGQRFVNLLPGDAPGERLRSGSVIPMSRTAPGLDLTAVFNGFRPLFSALSAQQVNELSNSVVQVFQGETGTIQSLFQQTSVITSDLADRQQLLNRVISNLAQLLTQLGGHNAQLGQLIDNFDSLVSGLADDKNDLAGFVDGVGAFSTGLANVLHESQPQLNTDIARLNTVTQTLVQDQSGLDGVIKGFPDILATFTKPISTGNFLNAYLCNLTINLTQNGVKPASGTLPLVVSLNPNKNATEQLYANPIDLPATTDQYGPAATNSGVCHS